MSQTSSRESLGWAILGTGVLADRFIAPALTEHRDNHIAAILSRDLGRAQTFADRHGIRRPSIDYREVLADPEVDIVYVATPNAFHAEQTIEALNAGKHVLVEKPMALTVEEGERMIDAAVLNDRVLGVGFHLRHKPGNQAAKRAIASGSLGSVFFAEIEIGAGKSLYPYDTWRSEGALSGGGTVLHQGSHATDLARFLTGAEIVRVSSVLSEPAPEDVFTAICTMSDGTIVSVITHQLLRGTRPDYVVLGDAGWMEARNATLPKAGESIVVHHGEKETEIGTSEHLAYFYEVGAMAKAVRGQAELTGTGLDGLAGIRIAHAVYQSARTARSVEIAVG